MKRELESDEMAGGGDVIDGGLGDIGAGLGEGGPLGNGIDDLINDLRRFFDVHLICHFEEVFAGDGVPFIVNGHLVGVCPNAVGAIRPRHVVRRREVPSAVFIHEERDVLGMVVLVACYHIEDHPAEKFLGIGVRKVKLAHNPEGLFVRVGMQHIVVIVREPAECLHVYFFSVLSIKTARHEVCPSVFAQQAALGHVDARFFGKEVVDIFDFSEVLRVS